MRWQGAPFRTSGLLMLLGVNAGLVGWIWSLAASNNATRIDSSRWTVNWSDIGAKVTNQKPLDSYQRILAHPVFFKSREPFVPAPPPPRPSPGAPPPVVLTDPGLAVGGVMIRNGSSKAYLYSEAGMGAGWSAEGETFQGWKVKSVDKGGVKLEQAGRSIELLLYPRD